MSGSLSMAAITSDTLMQRKVMTKKFVMQLYGEIWDSDGMFGNYTKTVITLLKMFFFLGI